MDDGSADDTRDVVESFDERFRYVHQDNRGRSNARNSALKLVRGRYIAFLDSDDLFLPHKLQVQVSLLEEHPTIAWVYSSAHNIDERGRPYPVDYEATASGWIYSQIAFYIPLTITLPTVMVRREVMRTVGGFDEKMRRFEDTDMWRRISRRYEVLAISEPLVKLRTHSGNAMEHPNEVFQAVSYYVDKIFREDRDVDPRLLKQRASELFLHYGTAVFFRAGWRSLSRPFLLASLRSSPTQQAGRLLLATYTGTWTIDAEESARRLVRDMLGKLPR